MKHICFARFLVLYLAIVLLAMGCSKSDGPGQSGGDTYARFSQSGINAAADADSVAVAIRWSQTQWTLSAATNGFVTGFSRESGGEQSHGAITGTVYVRLKTNLSDQSRSQDIFIRNLETGEEEKMTITQLALSANNVVTILPASRHQKITGFGGMYNPKIWMGQSGMITSNEITTMFSHDALGYNILRLMVYANPADWQADVAGARLAQQYGAIIFASPWDCTEALAETILVDGKSYKHLKKENYQDYANHLVDYINFMKNAGVNLYAISVQNEPDADFTYWYPNEIVDFVNDYGDQIRATGVKLMSPEALGFQPSYTDAILNNANAFAKTDILVGHTYQGIANIENGYVKERNDYIRSVYTNKLLPAGKPMWMTEKYFNDEGSDLNAIWNYQLTNFGRELHTCMDVGFDAYVYWYLKRYEGMCGLIGIYGDSKNTVSVGENGIAKDGYILAHYAKYATGRTRVTVTPGSNISSSDFLTTAYSGTNDITIVLINRGKSSKIISFAVPSDISAVTAVETTVFSNMVLVDNSISNDKKSVRVRVSPESIISLKLLLN